MGNYTAEDRRNMDPSDFGIPKKRLYPMKDAEDVESAKSLFGKVPKGSIYRKILAVNILKKAKEFNVDTTGWDTIIHCAQEQVPPMSDGTSLGNTPPLTIDTFNETSKNVFTSGDFNKYKKTDLSNNRGPIIAQEQTLPGWDIRDREIPVKVNNNMTLDEKILYNVIFDDGPNLLNDVCEDLVVPYFKKKGLEQTALDAAFGDEKNGGHGSIDDINNLDHPSYGYVWLYPIESGRIESGNTAYVTYKCDGTNDRVVIKFTRNGDTLFYQMIKPEKSPVKIWDEMPMGEIGDQITRQDSMKTFEKTCTNKIDNILPSDLKKFIKNSGKTYYSYPAKYFAALGMLDSIEDISRIYIRDEFNHDHRVKKLDRNDWQKKMEILDDVLKDAAIPIGFSDDIGDLFILYKTSTGEIVESRHGQVLAKSWKEFESKLRKTSPDKFPERDTKFMKICKEKIETILPDDMKKFIQNNNWAFYQYSYPEKHLETFFMYDDISQIVDNFVRNEFKYNPAVSDDRMSNASGNAVELIDRVLEDTEILFGFNNDDGAMLYYKTSNGNIIMSHPSKIIAKSWKEFESKLKKTNLRDQHVQEAAVGASLLTLKNQLQRMVGNAFKFIGGSLVPKFTMQSNEKPEVSFDVNAVGQNVEVTPKYNGTPDTMHKRKGIAFMSAANTIADFVESIVSKYKPVMATEYVQDELFTRVQMLVGESATNDDFFPKRKL